MGTLGGINLWQLTIWIGSTGFTYTDLSLENIQVILTTKKVSQGGRMA